MDNQELEELISVALASGPATEERDAAKERLRRHLEETGQAGGWLYDLAADNVVVLQRMVTVRRD